MAREGITYEDVTSAAIALKADHQSVTVTSVRAWLGSGSNSTIAPLLRRWKAQGDKPVVGLDDNKAIEAELRALLTPLRESLQREGRQQAEVIADKKNMIITERQAQLDAVSTELMALKKSFNTVNDQYQLLVAEHSGALKTIDEQKQVAVRTQEQLAVLQQQLVDANLAKTEAQHQAERDRQALERARDDAVRQRKAINQEHSDAMAVLIADKQRSLETAQLEVQRVLTAAQLQAQAHSDLREKYATLRQAHDVMLENTVPTLRSNVVSLQEEVSLHRAGQEDHQRIREALAAVKAELAVVEPQAKQAQSDCDKLQNQLTITQAQVTDCLKALTEKEQLLRESYEQIQALSLRALEKQTEDH